MKKTKFVGKVFFGSIVGLLLILSNVSCGSLSFSQASKAAYRPLGNTPGAKIIDNITGDISLSALLDDAGINQAAYTALLQVARNNYSGNVDIYDVTWVRTSVNQVTYMCTYSVSGNVVSIDKAANAKATASSSATAGIEDALERAATQAVKNIPQKAKIAIVYITGIDRNTTDYITGELEHIWQSKGYSIVDRSQLNMIRKEQKFQLSGEVDDATAVSIGKFAGAKAIVTGRIDGEGNLRRLRLRILDTQTADVIGTASERL